MTETTLNDLNRNEKTLLELRDKMNKRLNEVLALIYVAQLDEFLILPDNVLSHYFSAIETLAESARITYGMLDGFFNSPV